MRQGTMFAAPFSIRCAVSCLCFPMFAVQGSLCNVRRAVRIAVRHSPRHSSRQSPRHFLFILPNCRYSMFAAPLAIRSSPFANRRAIRRAIRCRFSMSPDAFHTSDNTPFLVYQNRPFSFRQYPIPGLPE